MRQEIIQLQQTHTEAEFNGAVGSSVMAGGNTLFKEFDPHTAAKLVELGTETRFEPGMLLFKEDQEHSYYITSGEVALEQPTPGRALRVETLREGDFLGWSEFLGSRTRHFQARALTQVVVLTFDRELLREASECNPRFGYALLKHFLQ